MSTERDQNPFVALSQAMAGAVEKAGAATLMVDARRRLPASGIAFSAELVLTADHVVEREEEIRVGLPNGELIAAQVAGRDPGSDLALLRLEAGRATPAIAAAQAARVGQLALALGRPSLDGIQASLGMVSAIRGPVRTRRGSLLENYLRSDTIPYPGFSGGPLIDAAGEVLGINTSGLTPGASLTIPAALAWKTAQALAQHGHVRRGYLGVRSQAVALPDEAQEALGRPQQIGLLLVGVEKDSPAAQGGLMIGDILVGLAGEPLDDPDQLLARLVGEVVGQPTPVEILRGGQARALTVTIGERA